MDERILSIKLCRNFGRKPRSLIHLPRFKASEYRSMLIYYLGVCLKGVLTEPYLNHFKLLSSAIYKLLSESISEEDLQDANEKLNEFVRLFQLHYGENRMTMNVHMLKHLVRCVKMLGPLWSFSMFCFESNNGILGKLCNGSADILHEMAFRYLLQNSLTTVNTSKMPGKSEIGAVLLPVSRIKLDSSVIELLQKARIMVDNANSFTVFQRFKIGELTCTSMLYKKANKTIDYFIITSDGTMGKVKFYFTFNELNYAMIEEFIKIQKLDHVIEIVPTTQKVISAEEIWEKLIYMHIDGNHFVTMRPNRFEKD